MKTTDQTILNTQEAAGFLGVHVETIRRLARKGDLPSFKIGKDWRFRKDSLLDWMETSSHNSHNTEIIQTSCVLVIDDEASIRKLIRINLELEGYRVITAPNGRKGLELVRNNPIDLVLLDLKMPGMNGPEIISELIKIDPQLPVIIVTGHPDSQMMMNVNIQCPVMLVAKPINKKKSTESSAYNIGRYNIEQEIEQINRCRISFIWEFEQQIKRGACLSHFNVIKEHSA